MNHDDLQLLRRLHGAGINLRVENGRLKISAPKGAVTPELADLLRERKQALLRLLGDSEGGAIEHLAEAGPAPATFGQQRLWLLDRRGAGSAYHIAAGLDWRGDLDREAWLRAVAHCLQRHAALRTRLVERDGTLWQEVDAELPQVECIESAGQEQDIGRWFDAFVERPFALAEEAPVRLCLHRIAANRHCFFICIHHTAIDGWGLAVLLRELAECYRQYTRGATPQLPAIPYTVADLALSQRKQQQSEQAGQALDYWRTVLQAPVEPVSFNALQNGSEDIFAGGSFAFELPAGLCESLRGAAIAVNITPYNWLLATFQLLLGKCSGQRDVLVLIPLANRNRGGADNLVGFLANTGFSRVCLHPDMPFRHWLGDIAAATLSMLSWQGVPFEQLVSSLRERGEEIPDNVLFSLQTVSEQDLELDGIETQLIRYQASRAKFDLSLTIEQRGNRWTGIFEYRRAVLDAGQVRALADSYRYLLEQAVQSPQRPLSQFSLAPPLPPVSMPAAVPPVLQQIAGQVRRTPAAPAVLQGARQLCYDDLWRRVGGTAAQLSACGVGPGRHVGIHLTPGPETVIAILASHAVGAAYVPLDPQLPAERLAWQIEDAGLAAVFSDSGVLSNVDVPVLRVAQAGPADWQPATVAMQDAAYLIYTSGSTGQPKAARVHHGGLSRLVDWYRQTCVDAQTRILVISNPGFDLTQKNLLTPLTCGGVAGFPDSARFDPHAILTALREGRYTLVNCTPTAFHTLLLEAEANDYRDLDSLESVVLGGEPIQLEPLRRWQRRSGRQAQVVNSYGPTECSDVVAYHLLSRDLREQGSPVPIGRAVPGCVLSVVDMDGLPVPDGIGGELQIDGDCVGLGYYRRDELTERLFRAGGCGINGRRYLSGDRVVRRADGLIEYQGRRDHQIKFNGYRIELEEIEAALLNVEGIAQAAIAVRRDSADRSILAAYYSSRSGTALDEAVIKQALSGRLAGYQLPSRYVWLDGLPLTRSGKVDRKALPEVLPSRTEVAELPAALSDGERRLAAIWCDLLGVERVVADDDFFALGGHSMLALELARRVRQQLQAELAVDDVFRRPVLRDMAAVMCPESAELPAVHEGDSAPLTPVQRRLWFLYRLEGPGASYNMAAAYRLGTGLDTAALLAALRDVIDRHWILRSKLDNGTPVPALRVLPATSVEIERPTLTADAIPAFADEFALRPFNLTDEVLSRFALLDAGESQHCLLANIHHLACDGLSLRTLFVELAQAYRERLAGKQPWREPAPQFAAVARHLAGLRQDETYHRQLQELADALRGAPPESALPVDTARTRSAHTRTRRFSCRIDASLRDAVHRLAAGLATTPFCVLLAAWFLVLARYRRQSDLVVGVPIVCREWAGSENIIGPLLNTLAVRVDCGQAATLTDLIRLTAAALQFCRGRRAVAFEDVVERVNPQRRIDLSPLFQVQFVQDPVSQSGLQLDGVELQALPVADGSAKYDLNLHLYDDGEVIHLHFDYRSALYREQTIKSAADGWRHVLQRMQDNPECRLNALSLLDGERLARLHDQIARNDDGLPLDGLVHRLFENQVRLQPGRPALTGADAGADCIDYAGLERRANRLAHALLHAGVVRGTTVAVFQHRSVSRVVSLLAVLKAGACYLPIDPEWPAARRELVLQQAACTYMIVDERLRSLAGSPAVRLIAADAGADPALPDTAPDVTVLADDPCYLMFTSGSTGVPKGVFIRHGGVVHDLLFLQRRLALGTGHRVLQLTSFSFDPSVRDLFATLGSGACAVLLDDAVAKHPASIINAIVDQRVSHILSMVPTMLRSLLAENGRVAVENNALQVLMLNGERLTGDDCRRARAMFGDALQIVNQYGPTETTMTSATHRLTDGDLDMLTVPLGVPNANTALYIVDDNGLPLPQGAVGEIWISKPGVAAGYSNQPELNEKYFISPDWPGLPSARRCYRSGDLGRWRGDGVLEFLGRLDFQVKLRGNRIELGEIDAAIGRLAGPVHCAAVLHDVDGVRPQLVAFLDAAAQIDVDALKHDLMSEVPSHMVPAHFIVLPDMPLTSSGKVDRKRLPDPAPYLREKQSGGTGPQSELENIISAVWVELLQLTETPNCNANFFELGANSLIMVQARDRLVERLDIQLDVIDLFAHPSIAALAAHLAQQDSPPAAQLNDSAQFASRRRAALLNRRAARSTSALGQEN